MILKIEPGLGAARMIAEFVRLGVQFEAVEEGRFIVITFTGSY